MGGKRKKDVCVFEERVGTVYGQLPLLLQRDRESTRWLKGVDGGERENVKEIAISDMRKVGEGKQMIGIIIEFNVYTQSYKIVL